MHRTLAVVVVIALGLWLAGPNHASAQEPTPTAQGPTPTAQPTVLASDSGGGSFWDITATGLISVVGVGILGFWLFTVQRARMNQFEQDAKSARRDLDDQRKRCQEDIDRERRHTEQLREQHAAAEELLRRRVEDVERSSGIAPAGYVSAKPSVLPERTQRDLSDMASLLDAMRISRESQQPAQKEPPETRATHYLVTGNRHFVASDYSQALAAYAAALQLTPDDPTLLMNRGLALFNLGNQEEGLTSLYEALRRRPNDVTLLTNLGLALRFAGRHEQELEAFHQAVQLQPSSADLLVEQGVAKHHLHQYEEALHDYNQALTLQPGHAGALYNRACLHSRSGADPIAFFELRQAFTADPRYRRMALDDPGLALLRQDDRFLQLYPKVTISSGSVSVGGSVTIEVTANEPLFAIGAYSIDIVYDRSLVSATACTPHLSGVCNANYSEDTVRLVGASADGLRGDVLLASIQFLAGEKLGMASLSITVSTFTDSTSDAPRDISGDLILQGGTITIVAAEDAPPTEAEDASTD